ncbi:peptidylglycine alpha-hydroxylating monooxygenase-like protein [Leptotrombidium deliense]|uniref:peptidylglycine monooxygenase n=1 Tax=Leptotrombidium deliense TaxID=299467 RepID=A0A443SSA0_9ACAR|nr:peptidylglycine alpha-hydroxylating monooxygenase-like protein [Leptotrombidium deliense]
MCWTFVSGHGTVRKMDLLMPGVQPMRETYYCTAFRMNPYEHEYIVEFNPNATKNTAHHILIYGCERPGFAVRDVPQVVWNCGEMMHKAATFVKGPTCKGKTSIIYAWALDAPKLILPQGVGFKVGRGTGINFLVLQVHYGNHEHFMTNVDTSGISLSLLPGSSTEVDKRAGVLLMGTAGSIPPLAEEHMETSCVIEEDIEFHPFAFRTHTHKLGVAVSGWRKNREGWKLIGRHNPQEPQMFYPVNKDVAIRTGDVVAARCTMKNTKDHAVYVGSTGDDEMCNFYIMYYVKGDKILDRDNCFTSGPPYYFWRTDANVAPVPMIVDEEASKL